LVGVAMVMINFHIELCVESYVFHPGTSLGKRHLSTNWYQDETCRKCCRQDSHFSSYWRELPWK
jgi:hypothetical protein